MRTRHTGRTALVLLLAASFVGAQPDLRGTVQAWVASRQPQLMAELVELLAIPNLAADRPNIRRNADHLRGMLERRGFAAELLETLW